MTPTGLNVSSVTLTEFGVDNKYSIASATSSGESFELSYNSRCICSDKSVKKFDSTAPGEIL